MIDSFLHRLGCATLVCALACATGAWPMAARAQTATDNAADSATVEPAPPAAEGPASALRAGERVDEPTVDRPLTVPLFGRAVELTGYWEFTTESREELDLDRTRARNRRIDEHELKLSARTRPTADTEVLLQLVGLHEYRRTQGSTPAQYTPALERGQAWIQFERLAALPLTLQVGRVALVEPRAWWWDEDLDAARLRYDRGDWRIETGLAKELARVSSADDGIRPEVAGIARWFGQASWTWAPRQSLQAFWLVARDRSGSPARGSRFADDDAIDPSDLNATWIGLRAVGQWRPPGDLRLSYWADTALVRGREAVTAFDDGDAPRAEGTRERRVRGHAYDIGAALAFPGALRPTLSISRAEGSGGERSADLDANFRQTGLQENKARRGGAKRMALYGELLRPELSNLAVTSVGAAIRVANRSSIELVAHHYRQRVAAGTLVGTRLSTAPRGLSPDIGREYDLKFAWREWRQVELTFTWGRFLPGDAFAANRRTAAQLYELGLAVSF